MSEKISIDEIIEIKERVPVGRYQARLLDVDARESKAQKPMVTALFEVLDGEHAGAEITIFYSLVVTPGKRGGVFAGGILDLKKTFAAVGTPLPAGFNMPYGDMAAAEQIRKLYHKNLHGKTVEIAVLPDKGREQKFDSEGKPIVYTRAQVIGKKKTTVAAAGKSDIVDDLEEALA